MTQNVDPMKEALAQLERERDKVRRLETQLRDQEARYSAAVDDSTQGVVVHQAGKIVFANTAAAHLFGYDGPKELLGLDLFQTLVAPEEHPVLLERTAAFYRGEKRDNYPGFRGIRKDGSSIWILANGSLITWEGCPAILAFYTDITSRKRAELHERTRREVLEHLCKGWPLTNVLESIVVMVETEAPGSVCSILLLDKLGQRLLHGSAPHLPDFYNQAVHGVEIGPQVGSCGTAAFRKERVIVEDITTDPLWENYRELAHRAGVRSCWSEPIVSSTGQLLGTFAIYHANVQSPRSEELESIAAAAYFASIAIERSRSEEALRGSEERLRLAASAGGFGTYDRDLITNERVWSSDLRAIFGFGPDEIVNDESIRQRVHPDDYARSQAALDASFDPTGPGEFALQHRIFRPDGTIRWVDIRGRTLFEGEGDRRRPVRAVGVASDLTEQKWAEDERRRLAAQIQYSQKLESLGVMAGGIAHDFNNLLTSILGYADLALLSLAPGSQSREYIDEVVNGARRAADITQQMLAYSGRGSFQVQPVNLSTLIEEMTRLLEISVSKKCTLRYALFPNPPSCEADPTQMRQIIMNFVINASEAIGDSNGVIAISTGLMHCDQAFLKDTYLDSPPPEGAYVYLEVADTGCGMSEETRAKIFDPFFTTKFTGRGLGLAAVIGIVRGHRGAITIQSELGKGSTFKVFFPAISHPSAAPPASTPSSGKPWTGSGTVLVIDDEETIRSLARKMLETMGFSVLTAADGLVGMQIFREAHPRIRLVLLDMTMPRLDGEETFRELLRIQPTVRAILSSGYNQQTATTRFIGHGLAGFIQKPYRYDVLQDKIRDVLGE